MYSKYVQAYKARKNIHNGQKVDASAHTHMHTHAHVRESEVRRRGGAHIATMHRREKRAARVTQTAESRPRCIHTHSHTRTHLL